MKMQQVTKKEVVLQKTLNLKNIIGKDVLSKGGQFIGTVAEVRLHPRTLSLAGILISRGFFKKLIFIDKNYFSHVSQDAVILNIELSILLKGKKIVSSDGKIIGRVKEIIRKGTSNEMEGIVTKSLFSAKQTIPNSAIKSIGSSIILKSQYNARKRYFWHRNK